MPLPSFQKAYIPYGAYWSTPFCRWQGSFANLHSMEFAASVARRALQERGLSPGIFDNIVMGITVPQKSSFYGAPWLAGMVGAPHVTGAAVSQACATSAKCVSLAAQQLEVGASESVLVMACDRTSNGPHVYYPNPLRSGGTGEAEDWVWDNFGHDPYAHNSMLQTAENVAREAGITRESQDEVTLVRCQQYQDALKNGSAFLRKFMVTPIEVKGPDGRKSIATVTGDEGVFPTTAEGLARLKPVLPGGTVTYGTQTYPADGNVGMVVTTKDKARELGRDKGITVQVLAFAEARAKVGFMAQATVPAARLALSRAGIEVKDLKAVKTHNPFAVNDIYMAQELGLDLNAMNEYGCSLVWGHPQGPTGLRQIIELIEILVERGGGYGLFDGCAAGDSAAAVVIKVSG